MTRSVCVLLIFLFASIAGALAATPPPAGSGALPNAPGKTVVVRVCSACHGLATFSADRMSRAEWERIVDQMISRGAKATPSQRRAIIDYLARHLGPARSKPTGTAGTRNQP